MIQDDGRMTDLVNHETLAKQQRFAADIH